MEPISINDAIKLAVSGLDSSERQSLEPYLAGQQDLSQIEKSMIRPEIRRAVILRLSNCKLTGDGVSALLSRAGALIVEKRRA
jgi:hypothetical protein